MIGRKINSARPVNLSEVEEVLAKRKEEGELGFEQQATLDYASKFKKLDKDKAYELATKVRELVGEKISEESAVKIADILPRSKEELLVILARERAELSEGQIKEVIKLVEEYTS